MDNINFEHRKVFKCLDMAKIVETIRGAVLHGYQSKSFHSLLIRTLEILKKISRSSVVRLYNVDNEEGTTILEYDSEWDTTRERFHSKKVDTSVGVAHAVSALGLARSDPVTDSKSDVSLGVRSASVICAPILSPEGTCLSVIEFFRPAKDEPFSEADEKIICTVVGWLGKIMPTDASAKRQKSLAELTSVFLSVHQTFLNICQCAVQADASMEVILGDVMVKMKDCVGASRAKVFLFPDEDAFRWPPEHCDCYEHPGHPSRWYKGKHKVKVEFRKDTEIAWHAVTENTLINVKDPSSEQRLEGNIDSKYGYTVNNMISFPIQGESKIVGAANVMNKLDGPHFTDTDEKICRTMGQYLAFILNCTGLTTKYSREQLEHEVTQNVFSYQLHPSPVKVESLITASSLLTLPEEFFRFTWYPLAWRDKLEILAYYMIENSIDEVFAANRPLLAKFILVTRRSYNPISYHNFEHAVNVLHCVYNIIKMNPEEFSTLEVTALAVAALCHDAGHSGVSHKSISLSGDVYQRLYDDSESQCNHCEAVAGIIKDLGLFEHLPKDEYRDLLTLIMHNIRSTDIALAFETRLKILETVNRGEFDLTVIPNRNYFMSFIMCAADLSGQSKPVEIAVMISLKLFQEFYRQGDAQKKIGLCPVHKMNRDLSGNSCDLLLFFLLKISKPIFEMLEKFLPNTKPLLDGTQAFIEACQTDRDIFTRQMEENKNLMDKIYF